MRKELIISGFGGQGVMLAGTLLCEAAIKEDKFVTFFPSYGAEIRGGTANCQVIISDESIGSPIASDLSMLISLNELSFKKFKDSVSSDGLILINSSLFDPANDPSLSIIRVPANNIAEDCGSVLASNIVMLGVLIARSGILKIDSLKDSIADVLTKRKKKYWKLNEKALDAGFNFLKT